jgi:hypothetical protein
MVACVKFPVDYQATTLNTRIQTIGPIVTFSNPPPDQYQPNALGFAGQFNGVNQLVCMYIPSKLLPSHLWLTLTTDSYGGALLFIAFLAEMRHPMDFWKGLLVAQMFICFVYILFGAFVSYFPYPSRHVI